LGYCRGFPGGVYGRGYFDVIGAHLKEGENHPADIGTGMHEVELSI